MLNCWWEGARYIAAIKASHIYFEAIKDDDYGVLLATRWCVLVKINFYLNGRGNDHLIVWIFFVDRIWIISEGLAAERTCVLDSGGRPGVRYYQQF